jgi:hypothetical protein
MPHPSLDPSLTGATPSFSAPVSAAASTPASTARAPKRWTGRLATLALVGIGVGIGVGVTDVERVEAQVRPAAPLQAPYFAWDDGRYVEAMEGYLAVLRGPQGAAHRREAAILTGELHPAVELDLDGRGLRFSGDGRWVAWNVPGSTPETRVAPVTGGAQQRIPAADAQVSAAGVAAWISPDGSRLEVRDLGTGATGGRSLDGVRIASMRFVPDQEVLILAGAPDPGSDRVSLFRAAAPGWALEPLPLSVPVAAQPEPAPGGRVILFAVPARSPFSTAAATATPTGGPQIGLFDVQTGRTLTFSGTLPTLSRDGRRLAFFRSGQGGAPSRILTVDLSNGVPASEAAFQTPIETTRSIGDPALSPNGTQLAFKVMVHVDWEIFHVDAGSDGRLDPGTNADPPAGLRRITRETQHDQFPAWIDEVRLIALKGEARHRRAHLYNLSTGEEFQLFHNNTLRTISPEYEWVPSPNGRHIAISAERDGNTISPERGAFLMDLNDEVTLEALITRLQANLTYEQALLAEGEARYAPMYDEVMRATRAIQVGRVFHAADALYRMGSKFVGQPGNLEAMAYLQATLESWGLEVELEWFEARGAQTANVIGRLRGTENPELIYTISSHFDSVLPSPGADDNTSGTTALLEVARVLAEAGPRKATIEFAFLTAEEAGLLGAREYVRLAVQNGKQIIGVLNNDMIGWNRNHRLDNTIRYSNPGIMRIQHAAAHFFSDLITYDALYYRGTDGAVFYEAYGDIVGGIGSYPVLGNPNYHQRTDQVETINHRLVAEVARTTAASIMFLADAPSRLQEVRVGSRTPEGIEVVWTPAPEQGVTGYRVQLRSPEGAVRELGVTTAPRFVATGVRSGETVEVRAIRSNGTEGWDWAGVIIP